MQINPAPMYALLIKVKELILDRNYGSLKMLLDTELEATIIDIETTMLTPLVANTIKLEVNKAILDFNKIAKVTIDDVDDVIK